MLEPEMRAPKGLEKGAEGLAQRGRIGMVEPIEGL
jgi:hypothetical protein